MSILPNDLRAMRIKVRKMTARISSSEMTDAEIDSYINTFYVYDFPEHLRLESLRVNYQFTTTANIPVYDFPTDLYLTNMPPVYIGGYQSYMTQSRGNFFRINPQLNFIQSSIATGTGVTGPYTGQLINTPIIPGFKPNPPGAYSSSVAQDIAAKFLNWNVIISALAAPDATSGVAPSVTLVDDGQGNLFDPSDSSTLPTSRRGTINYLSGVVSITNFSTAIPTGNAINAQYSPYVASRPQECVFFQDQFILYPIPDQAYTVSFEAYKYPTAFLGSTAQETASSDLTPQLKEWWQLLAVGASLKIFEDDADFENMAKYGVVFQNYLNLVNRRTLVQQASERTATIYTEQTSPYAGWPFGNLFSGF